MRGFSENEVSVSRTLKFVANDFINTIYLEIALQWTLISIDKQHPMKIGILTINIVETTVIARILVSVVSISSGHMQSNSIWNQFYKFMQVKLNLRFNGLGFLGVCDT